MTLFIESMLYILLLVRLLHFILTSNVFLRIDLFYGLLNIVNKIVSCNCKQFKRKLNREKIDIGKFMDQYGFALWNISRISDTVSNNIFELIRMTWIFRSLNII